MRPFRGASADRPSAGFADALRTHAESRQRDAEAAYHALLQTDPDHEGALRFLGLLLAQRAELADAINGLATGGQTQSRRGDARFHVATALAALGRSQEAAVACRKVLEADAAHAPALVLLATLRREAGDLDEAVSLARRAVGAAAGWAAHNQLGLALAEQDRVVEAADALRRAAELGPNEGDVFLNLGNASLALGDYAAALEQFRRADELEPGSPGVHNNLAVTELAMGRFDAAALASKRAIALDPGNARYRYNLAFALLGRGELGPGWEVFDHGFAAGGRAPNRSFPVPRWDGSPLPDGRLLVWREQGVGDEIRLASCYPDVLRRVGAVVLETDHRLAGLFGRSFPGATVRAQATGPEPPDFDVHCPAGSLPRHVRPSVEAFGDQVGYLAVDPVRRERMRARLDALEPGLKVGISWRSMNLAVSRLSHYTVLDEWLPVLSVPGAVFLNLQYGPEDQLDAELEGLRDRTGASVHRWDDVDYTNDFDTVAALISALDLVVGVGTTPALLAGAVGRPVLMLALPDPMALGQAHYPWFPSMRRVVRRWDEPWAGPIERVAGAVRREVAAAQAAGAR